MSDVLHVEVRRERGSRAARKLRQAGQIPAVLYGHGQEVVPLSLRHEEIEAAVRHRAHLVSLEGGVTESALIQSIQWDTFGVEILHADFYRVTKGEKHEAVVAIMLRGEAPGSKQGGVVQQLLHEVEIMCPVELIPDMFEVSVNDLQLHQEFTAGQLKLPEGASLITSADEVVVHCVDAARMAAAAEESALPEGEVAEPEVIGRKKEETEEEGD
jgi:large subunit ribosomal protein L25